MATADDVKPARPKTLDRPVRKFVKQNGKKLLRWAARMQSRASIVPDTPVIPSEHFPFLKEFEDRWEPCATRCARC